MDGRNLNETVEEEVEALPEDMRASLARITMLIEQKGLERVVISTFHQEDGEVTDGTYHRTAQEMDEGTEVPKAYEALEEEFVLASAVIDVRNRAGLTQAELARKMGTTQPIVARLESGRSRPSMRTLERLADATGSRLLISFAPRTRKRPP